MAAAFEAFLSAIGPARPFVLAGHSQGSAHVARLILDRLRDAGLRRRLVVAYAPGYPIPADAPYPVPACRAPDQTGCLASWNAFTRRRYIPPFFRNVPTYGASGWARLEGRPALCTSPARWFDGPLRGYLGGFYRVKARGPRLRPSITEAVCRDGWLVIDAPKDERFSEVLMSGGWYHVYEYALFWAAIRANVAERIGAYAFRSEPRP